MPDPSMPAHPDVSGRDFCSEHGAHVLAGMIRAAWARVGVTVATEVVRVSTPAADERSAIYSVRIPGLINGLPPRAPV